MRYVQTALKWISILAALAAAIIGIALFGAKAGGLLLFFVFLAFWVWLPGLFLIELTGLSGSHLSTRIARGFFAGFGLQIALYFIADLTGTDLPLLAIGPILSFGWLMRIFRERKRGEGTSAGQLLRRLYALPASIYVFTAAVFLYALNTTQFTYISPARSGYASIRTDFEFHCGIMNALAQGYPALNPWVDGREIHYHYFTEMLYAVPMRLFDLTSEAVLLSYAPYLVTAVLTICLYSFFREMMRRSDRIGLYCLALAGANMFMVKSFASSWFFYHMVSNINSACFGICALLVALPVLKVWDQEKLPGGKGGLHVREVCLLLLLALLMTGSKGPVGVVFAGALFGTFALGLFFRRDSLRLLVPLALCGAGFLMVYTFVIGGGNGNSSGGSLINIGEVTDIAYFKDPLMEMLAGMGLPTSLRKLALLAVFLVFYFTSFIIPFVIGYVREVVLVLGRKKPYQFARIAVYAAVMIGFLGMMVLNYSGHSQVYFGFVASILVPAVSFWFFEDMEENKGVLMRLVMILFIFGMICSAATFAFHLCEGFADAADRYQSRDELSNKYRGVTAQEYEGLVWLRNHSDEEDLVISDRYYSVNPDKYDYTSRWDSVHFAYAVYSQRRQYLEGSGFSLDASENGLRKKMIDKTERFYDPSDQGREELAEKLGADYLIVSKRFHDAGSLEDENFRLVYSNGDMDIYEIEE